MLKLLSETSNELCSKIRNDRLRYSMEMNDLVKIDLGILFSIVSSMHGKEMGSFGLSINYYPYRIMPLGSVG
jgi:hypothetical protein